MLILILQFFLIFQSAYSIEVTTLKNEEDPDIFETEPNMPKNVTATIKVEGNKRNITETINMQRITQPSQTQQVERTIAPNNATSNKFSSSTNTKKNFKPSPQLETYYEYNKFPVPPAFPEAKHFNTFQNPPEFPYRKEITPWTEKTIFTTEQPWVSRVKFPAPEIVQRPYNFVNNDEKLSENFNGRNQHEFSFNKPVPVPEHNFNVRPTSFGIGSTTRVPVSTEGAWEKFSKFFMEKKRPIPAIQKTNFDYNLLEKPVSNVHKTYESGLSNEGHGIDPWKKIVKFLTAFIPISLLISALTPTVITVTSVNDTQSRYRAVDSNQVLAKRIVSSFNRFNDLSGASCENRILCELLVSASNSKNAEEHVQNLLNNFAEQEKNIKDKADDLKKVFEAVKRQNCAPIVCKNVKT